MFIIFVARMIKFKKHLDGKYRVDIFLNDQILTAVYKPEMQSALKGGMPRKAQMVIHRIANRLSDKL